MISQNRTASSSALISKVIRIYQANLINMSTITSTASYVCPHHLDRESPVIKSILIQLKGPTDQGIDSSRP